MGEAMAEVTESIGEGQMTKKLWKVEDVADFLGLAVGSVYHLLSQRRIPVVRISARCVRFDPQVIEAWVVDRTESGATIATPKKKEQR